MISTGCKKRTIYHQFDRPVILERFVIVLQEQ
jgi:hypothetical protein